MNIGYIAQRCLHLPDYVIQAGSACCASFSYNDVDFNMRIISILESDTSMKFFVLRSRLRTRHDGILREGWGRRRVLYGKAVQNPSPAPFWCSSRRHVDQAYEVRVRAWRHLMGTKFLKMDKEKEKDEIENEIRLLKIAFEIHSNQQFIKGDKEFEKHIDAILDRISELEKKLNEL